MLPKNSCANAFFSFRSSVSVTDSFAPSDRTRLILAEVCLTLEPRYFRRGHAVRFSAGSLANIASQSADKGVIGALQLI